MKGCQVFITILLSLLAFLCADAEAGLLKGLRGGTVSLLSQTGGATFTVRLTSAYGWDERAVLYDRDGRIFHSQPSPPEKRGSVTTLRLGAPGLYHLRLARSFVADIEAPKAKLAFSPLRHQTSFLAIPGQQFFFSVPENIRGFSLHFSNRIGMRGDVAKLQVTSPGAEDTSLECRAFSPASLRATLGLYDDHNQSLSHYSPHSLPDVLLPAVKFFDKPSPGIWKLVFTGKEGGLWFEGVPDIVAASPDDLKTILGAMESRNVSASASVHIGSPLERIPFLGAVGAFDPLRYRKERVELGIGADQLFLWPPKSKNGRLLSFPIGWARPDSPQMHSLLVLRGREGWMKKHPQGKFVGFASWAAEAVHEFIRKSQRDLDTFTVQVFSEPNLEMSYNEYDQYFWAVVERFRSDPLLRNVRLGGPALGSNKESGLVDWHWIERLLGKYGQHISAICWNNYRLRDPEDTALIAPAIQHTRALADSLGLKPDIFIGGINRLGGLAPPELFRGDDAGIWWASLLASAININELSGIWYFQLADVGIRAKGLLTSEKAGLRPKIQAYVHQAFAHTLQQGQPVQFLSDHDLIDGIAVTTKASTRCILLLNKGWLPINVNFSALGSLKGKITFIVGNAEGPQPNGKSIVMPPYALASFVVQQ